jgi:dihydrofolate reductase
MFREIRAAHPGVPIIILTRPKYTATSEEKIRRSIIKATYENALASADRNVYFIDGKTLMRHCHNEGTVDNCHPNDWGFYSMARALINVLKNKIKL